MSGHSACIGVALATVLLLSPLPAQAIGITDVAKEQIRTFATCAGRMMALRDYLALFGAAGVDQAESARAQHLEILDALLEMADQDSVDFTEVFQWRVEARAAQGAILTQRSFGTTPGARARATEASERHIDFCNRLILGA